jgi:Trk K+ transport system NAD-binding subunit
MLGGVAFASILFSFIVDWLLARRAEHALGRMQYRVRGHMILCGLGRLGYQVAIELLRRGHKVLVIESEAENRFAELVRGSGGMVFVADATLARNLRRANIGHAKVLLSVIQNDLKNLEIGLIARSLHPKMALVLRIFDKDIAKEVQTKLDIPAALSASSLVADQLLVDF